ncbi:MAG: gamma-glutamyl-gamma-aminobutyrate hydrolase family protein [Sciscionella sp.]
MVSNGSRPLIGITTYLRRARFGVWDTEASLLHRSYSDAVVCAGGVPVLLPATGDGYPELAATLDGLILAGGADIDPARYQQRPHPSTGDPASERDEFEFALLHAALALRLPVFGVCRGMEVLNVALGGSLTQHLPDLTGHGDHQPAPGVFGTTTVRTQPGSLAESILGHETKVRCYHHQAVGELAGELVATGWAADGTVEAVERAGRPFVIGVQWHPEEDTSDIRLFSALVAAARHRRAA